MAAILSLEPMLHALPLVRTGGEKSEVETVDSASSSDQQSLAARLQRLWQERGDFSKLSIEKLKAGSNADEDEGKADEELQKNKADQDGDDVQDGETEQREAAGEESMTQEQLWDLKLGILQGLECVEATFALQPPARM